MHLFHLAFKEDLVVVKVKQHDVLVAITFDMKFYELSTGQEGSARDYRILIDAFACLKGFRILKGNN